MSAGLVGILGFAGSLRSDSYNRALLRVADGLLPANALLEAFDLAEIPLYNEDLHRQGWPQSVHRFRQKIADADALLIVTPEYNFSIPGVLKNAIDWASRPHGEHPCSGKPVAIMGASAGVLGTARAQYHLRQVCGALNMYTINQPEVFIGNVRSKFSAQGCLADENARSLIARLLGELVDFTIRMRKPMVAQS